MKNLPESLHFVGIGGIGMSALAQMAAAYGCNVTGSDRAANAPENKRIFDALRSCGIRIFPQDGSRFQEKDSPEALVYSTAIENDNPDFAASQGIPRIHRSEALRLIVEKTKCAVYAVTGSCGKTSVSAWLAEALDFVGENPSFISGGLAVHFAKPPFAGNAWKGSGKFCVLEADESDKSLLNYTADCAMILNIGTDHYSREELARVFGEFLRSARSSAVVQDKVLEAVGTDAVRHLKKVAVFTIDPGTETTCQGYPLIRAANYQIIGRKACCTLNGYPVTLPAPGIHNAANAAAVCAALRMLDLPMEKCVKAVEHFSGVWRRFDPAGTTPAGTAVFDDYAHNVEKICSCIEAAKEITSGRLLLIFQPHGFGPFGFMRDELFPALEKTLGKNDLFRFMPVYYAGGTTSFKPTADEVAAEYTAKHPGERYGAFPDRDAANAVIGTLGPNDTVVIMGARDNSLSDWAKSLGKL